MNIKARINARKVTLTFFYEMYFVEYYSQNVKNIDDILRVERDLGIDQEEKDKEEFVAQIKGYYSIEDYETEIEYIIQNLYKKEQQEGIDMDYVLKVVPNYAKYINKVEKLVNKESISFKFDEMDLIDRMIFLLGYIEHEEILTPKKVILNEMIELAKRFGDEGSQKLINGIGHKLIKEDEEDKEDKELKLSETQS